MGRDRGRFLCSSFVSASFTFSRSPQFHSSRKRKRITLRIDSADKALTTVCSLRLSRVILLASVLTFVALIFYASGVSRDRVYSCRISTSLADVNVCCRTSTDRGNLHMMIKEILRSPNPSCQYSLSRYVLDICALSRCATQRSSKDPVANWTMVAELSKAAAFLPQLTTKVGVHGDILTMF